MPGVTPAASVDPATPVSPATPAVRATAAPVHVRSDRVLERESATMVSEMKRVGLVSAVCFGMLAVLVVVERLQ